MRLSVLFLALASLLPMPVSADGNAEDGKVKSYTCKGCHGITGYNNVYPTYKVPKIGGQNAPYLSAALKAYQAEMRAHPTMQAQAQSLSEQDIADIAAWLASLDLVATPDGANQEPPAESQVCQACHGPQGLSADPSYPVLAGQYRDYLVKALEDYRSGARRNAVMAGFAGQLSDADIETLAAWYSSRKGLRDLSGK